MFFHHLRIFYLKEFKRLKHNPAALMAVGLMIIMAFLINVESNSIQKSKKIAKAAPCVVAYDQASPLIAHLKRNKHPKLPIRFIKSEFELTSKSHVLYPRNTNCAAEISFSQGKRTQVNIIFRNSLKDQARIHGLSRWLLSNAAAFYSNFNINQQVAPFTAKANSATKQKPSFDLGNKNAKSMVSAMLLFSTQFFICCALFLSLTANEKEKGVINALALTTASTKQILFAKYLFHLSISLVASIIVLLILDTHRVMQLTPLLAWIPLIALTSINLTSIAAIIVSFSKTQTSASLFGFCYLMLVGVVFALSKQFFGFAILKQLMFENHAITLYKVLMAGPNGRDTAEAIQVVFGGAYFVFITLVLFVIASIIWVKKVTRN